jgi:aryl-alcohol dehydrogenase-like predicted oxidoreductase
MRTRRLGSHGPDLSVIGFGAWEAGGTSWGANASDDAVVDAMRAGFDAGIDWIDTAEVYGAGVSEELVGRAIDGRRDTVTVATKVAPRPTGSGFRPEEVRAACDASLARLGVETIDLFQLHWPDDDVPVEETWGAMAGLVDAGKVRWIGVSNFDRTLIERCEAVRHVDSLQPEFSFLRRREADLIAWCGDRGIGVVSYAPLAYGLLTGAITETTTFAEGDWRGEPSAPDPDDPDEVDLFDADVLPRVLDVVGRLRPIAARLDLTLPQLALAWNTAQPGVTSAIAGSRNAEHARSNALAGDLELDDDVLAELEAISPDGHRLRG